METERFGNASKTDIDKSIENSKYLNTVKQTNKWMSAYLLWAKLRNQETEIHKPPFEWDPILQPFFCGVEEEKLE